MYKNDDNIASSSIYCNTLHNICRPWSRSDDDVCNICLQATDQNQISIINMNSIHYISQDVISISSPQLKPISSINHSESPPELQGPKLQFFHQFGQVPQGELKF